MRKDMFKVIVERPRQGHRNPYKSDGRAFRNDEESGNVLGIKAGYQWRKWLNENLAPLERFLRSRRGQHWDKVYAEIRSQINADSTVQQHVLQHLYDFVACKTYMEGDKIMVIDSSWGTPAPLAETGTPMYVHPISGQLLENRQYGIARRKDAATRQRSWAKAAAQIRVLDAMTELHCIDGNWYRITFAPLPAYAEAERFDLLLRRKVCRKYGSSERYAAHKQQLSAKEIEKWKLLP